MPQSKLTVESVEEPDDPALEAVVEEETEDDLQNFQPQIHAQPGLLDRLQKAIFSTGFIIQVGLFGLIAGAVIFLTVPFNQLESLTPSTLVIPLVVVLILYLLGKSLGLLFLSRISRWDKSPIKQCEFGHRVIIKGHDGKIAGIRGDGLYHKWFWEEEFDTVDVRERPEEVETGWVQCRDNNQVQVVASVMWEVDDLGKAILFLRDYERTVREWCQKAVGDVAGESTLDELSFQKSPLEAQMVRYLQARASSRPGGYGIHFNYAQIEKVRLTPEMENAMTAVARQRAGQGAASIQGDTEIEVADKFMEAARKYSNDPVVQGQMAFNLRQMSKAVDGQGTVIVNASSGSGFGGGNGITPVPVPVSQGPKSQRKASGQPKADPSLTVETGPLEPGEDFPEEGETGEPRD